MVGKVYLVGAGPGDPKLITVKGMECIKHADVIVYDRLAGEELLKYASENAELIYVGKSPEKHTLEQDEISMLLVEKAREGKKVVRLKGGDPFVFGRGGEEAQLLHQNDIPFEIVPGITSAIAVPAYAGIPVTHRGYASSFHVITGHEGINKGKSSLDWGNIAHMEGTLIFLMGMANLPLIVDMLMKNGQSPERSVAIIQWGTTARQRTLIGTLSSIVRLAEEQGIKSPAIIVVGEVVKAREELKWLEKKPLWGKRIIVTRARQQASILVEQLEELGADVVEFPTIKTEPMANCDALDTEIKNIDTYQWLIFTSVNGVKFFFERLKHISKDIRVLGKIKLCAIGPATRSVLEDKGLIVDYTPHEYKAEAVAEGLKSRFRPGEKVLIARAEFARDVLEKSFAEIGVQVKVVPVYRTVIEKSKASDIISLINNGQVDWITFTSSSTVRNFIKIVKGDENSNDLKNSAIDLDKLKVACIGPITAGTAKELGLRVDAVADEYTIPGLVKAILEYE